MNLRRWLLVGGASIAASAAILVPAGSSATFASNAKYEGTINGSTANGGTVQGTKNPTGTTCTLNSTQSVGVVDLSGPKANSATSIKYTITNTGGASSGTAITSGTFSTYGSTSLGGTTLPCDSTGISVLFEPQGCPDASKCASDTVTAFVNLPYE